MKRIFKTRLNSGYIKNIFDPYYYIESCGASISFDEALEHYVNVGSFKMLSPNPLFDPMWYSKLVNLNFSNSLDAVLHYLNYGTKNRLDPHPLFSISTYENLVDTKKHNHLNYYISKFVQREYNPVSPSIYFDCEYYLRHSPDVAEAELDPLIHYLTYGWKEHRNPSPYFDVSWYLLCNPDVRDANIEPLQHYISLGLNEGRQPHPLIDIHYYLLVSFDVEEAKIDPFRHYIEHGDPEGRSAHPLFNPHFYRLNGEDIGSDSPFAHYSEYGAHDMRRPCPEFDPSYYLRQNVNIASIKLHPLTHYLTYGWKEHRNPSPYFDVSWYLQSNPDVRDANIEPLQHYISLGLNEGRQPHPLIDIHYYFTGAPDVLDANLDPFKHYIEHGDREGRSAHPLFNPHFYRSNGEDIGSDSPFAHYSEYGISNLRSPCAAFDPAHYVLHNPDAIHNPLQHYLLSPSSSKRHFHPLLDSEYQNLTSQRAANGADPLIDYMQFRSHFNPSDIARGAAFIPKPTRSHSNNLVKSFTFTRDQQFKVSVVVPCYNSDEKYLEACVNSVVGQSYENWELILIDDGSPNKKTWPLLQFMEKKDARIKSLKLNKNQGISDATNAAVNATDGVYLAFLDHDDVLTKDALKVMVANILLSDADAAYSDQAYVSASNVVDSAFFKPDWSPILFSGVMYLGHLLMVRKATAIDAGLFNKIYDGCQDFEFMLRVSEKTNKIIHVPHILYHWRRSEGSVALNSDAKGKIEPKQAKAVNEHFKRINFAAIAKIDERVSHRLKLRPKIISTSIGIDLVIQGPVSEIEVEDLLNKVVESGCSIKSTSIVDWNLTPFEAVKSHHADWILFINPKIDFLKKTWLNYLTMYIQQASVAFASTHIYHNDGIVLSAGYVISPDLGPIPAYKNFKAGQDGNAGTLICDREVSAVGAVCTLVSRETIKNIGGFKSEYVSLEGMIIDASFRATQQGLRNVSVATQLINVNTKKTTDKLQNAIDKQIFIDKYSKIIAKGDCYYNPNFIRNNADFSIG